MRKYVSVVVLLVVVGVSGVLLAQSSQRSADLHTRITALEREQADSQAKVTALEASLERERAASQAKLAALEQERTTLTDRLHPLEDKQRASLRINQDLVINAGTTQTHTFSLSVVPGTLTGTWRASGRGSGGVGDTITGVRLTDPKDALLYSAGIESSGQFVVKITAPGNYTFNFDNRGLLRSTSRRVFLDAEFRPD